MQKKMGVGHGAGLDLSTSKSFLLHGALGVWGLSSWLLFNGIWGQLPLFVKTLPEGNRLAVMVLAAEQMAYIFPMFFMYKKRHYHSRRAQETDIWALLFGGLLISLLLSNYWNFQKHVFGENHSVGLLVLSFFTGAICSSTGIVFTPYLSSLPKSFTAAHTAGAGLSGLTVAALTLLADPGAENPRIPVNVYFHVVSAAFVLSIISFYFVRQTVNECCLAGGEYEELDCSSSPPSAVGMEEGRQRKKGYGATDHEEEYDAHGHHHAIDMEETDDDHQNDQPPRRLWPIFALQCLLAALAYGVVPSILPIACTGYVDSSRVLMLASVGFMCADPLGKIVTSFIHSTRVYFLGLCTMGLAAYLLYSAFLSPHPPFSQHAHGGLSPILAYTLFSFFFSFTSISIFFERSSRRDQHSADEKREAYLWFSWSAFMIQTGAFLGTAIALVGILEFAH